MFPAIMPWPRTLPPQIKLSDVKIMQKNLIKVEKISVMIQEVMQIVRIVLLSKSVRFCESRRRKN
jgi:hypothetical protein